MDSSSHLRFQPFVTGAGGWGCGRRPWAVFPGMYPRCEKEKKIRQRVSTKVSQANKPFPSIPNIPWNMYLVISITQNSCGRSHVQIKTDWLIHPSLLSQCASANIYFLKLNFICVAAKLDNGEKWMDEEAQTVYRVGGENSAGPPSLRMSRMDTWQSIFMRS